jgi:hypothetical protein
MANRFRLVQQPIASLVGDGEAMFDLVVRMLDESGNEVLPSEFLAAAQRTDLMKNIDRWVVGAAMSFCATRKPHRVFVRLSRDSMRDQTLGTWLPTSSLGRRSARGSWNCEETAASLPRGRSPQALVKPLGFAFMSRTSTRPDSRHCSTAGELREDRRLADAGPRHRSRPAGAGWARAVVITRRAIARRVEDANLPCCGGSAWVRAGCGSPESGLGA